VGIAAAISKGCGMGGKTASLFSHAFHREPNAFFHFLPDETLTPSAGGRFGKVDEWTLGRLQVLDPLEDLTPSCRDEACSHAGCVDEILTTVEAHNQGIDAQMAGHVATNRKLLPKVDPILTPEPVR